MNLFYNFKNVVTTLKTDDTNTMTNHHALGLVVTVFLFGVALSTANLVAAIATMFSGACVGALALYKLVREVVRDWKNKRK